MLKKKTTPNNTGPKQKEKKERRPEEINLLKIHKKYIRLFQCQGIHSKKLKMFLSHVLENISVLCSVISVICKNMYLTYVFGLLESSLILTSVPLKFILGLL